MWKIIKQYYLLTFIVILIGFSIRVVGTKSPNTVLENFLVLLVASFIVSAAVGTIYYFMDTKWGPKKREKRLLKAPFIQLLEKEFNRQGDFLTGTIDGYTANVMFVWLSGNSAIQIEVLFDPRSLPGAISFDEIKQMEKRYRKPGFWLNQEHQEHEWTRSSVAFSLPYNFSPPSAEDVIRKAQDITDMLIKENIKPISLEDLKDIEKRDIKL